MTKERIWLIFIILVIAVIAIGLSVQLSSKEVSKIEEREQASALIDSSPANEQTQDSKDILGATEELQKIVPKQVGEGCFVAGCSNQICTDVEDIQTACEWHDTYACYNNATCERQPDGECGWTRTEEIMQCIRETIPDVADLI